MRIKNLLLLLIGSLVISGVTAVNKEKAVAGEALRTKNIVADVKPGSVRSRNVLAAKGYTDDEILKLAKKYFGNNGGGGFWFYSAERCLRFVSRSFLLLLHPLTARSSLKCI